MGRKGIGAHGDLMYRLEPPFHDWCDVFQYMHYSFTGIYGSTDIAYLGRLLFRRFSRARRRFSATAGVSQYENIFVETVPIDPAIAAVIGISSAQRVTYLKNLHAELSFPALQSGAPRHGLRQRFAQASTPETACS